MSVKKTVEIPKRIIEEKNVLSVKNLLKRQKTQIGLSEKFVATFEKGSYVILDFGSEYRGKVRILTFKASDCKCRLRLGESVSEVCSDIGEKNSTNDHSIRDGIVELVNYSDMTFFSSGFRFVRLDCISGSANVKSILIESEILNLKPVYEYKGKDELIGKIFNTAKRTVDLCSAGEYIWDGIKRDRLVWIGDLHPEMLALTTLYGKVPQVEKSLTFVKNQTSEKEWVNGIASYSMWWIIIATDYYKISGNKSFIVKSLGFIKNILKLMDGCVREDGETAYPWNFLDWPTADKKDVESGVRALSIIAVKKAIGLLKETNEDISLANGILVKLNKKEISATESKQVAAMKYFAVGLNEDDKRLLVDGGAQGMSTFMSYYILTAIASFDKNKAVEIMKEYYGKMLDLGATTFFEDFDVSWAENACRIDEKAKDGEKDVHGDFGAYCYQGFRHSLCHGWSSGVIKFIKENC